MLYSTVAAAKLVQVNRAKPILPLANWTMKKQQHSDNLPSAHVRRFNVSICAWLLGIIMLMNIHCNYIICNVYLPGVHL